jgi:hypothetical protein
MPQRSSQIGRLNVNGQNCRRLFSDLSIRINRMEDLSTFLVKTGLLQNGRAAQIED